MNEVGEYQKLAIRTIPEDTFTRKMLHCAMGMMGELGELMELSPNTVQPKEQVEGVVGEIGDCFWYVANLCEIMGLDFEHVLDSPTDLGPRPNLYGEKRAVMWAARLIDITKKVEFYGKEPPMLEIIDCIYGYVHAVKRIAEIARVPVLYALQANIKKLEARYPDLKFNREHALNRDYEAESLASGEKIV